METQPKECSLEINLAPKNEVNDVFVVFFLSNEPWAIDRAWILGQVDLLINIGSIRENLFFADPKSQ